MKQLKTAPGTGVDVPYPIDKWQMLRELRAVRREVGLSNSAVQVLEALLACDPSPTPDGMRVYPSNAKIAHKCGISISTVKRGIAALIDCGLAQNFRSANGKRFRCHVDGHQVIGIDLTSLSAHYPAISQMHEELRNRETEAKALRAAIRACLATVKELALVTAEEIAAICKSLRRARISVEELRSILTNISARGPVENPPINAEQTGKLDRKDAQNEPHIESDKDSFDKTAKKKDHGDTLRVCLKRLARCKAWKEYFPGREISDPGSLARLGAEIVNVLGLSGGELRRLYARTPSVIVATAAIQTLEYIEKVKSPTGYIVRVSNQIVGEISGHRNPSSSWASNPSL